MNTKVDIFSSEERGKLRNCPDGIPDSGTLTTIYSALSKLMPKKSQKKKSKDTTSSMKI